MATINDIHTNVERLLALSESFYANNAEATVRLNDTIRDTSLSLVTNLRELGDRHYDEIAQRLDSLAHNISERVTGSEAETVEKITRLTEDLKSDITRRFDNIDNELVAARHHREQQTNILLNAINRLSGCENMVAAIVAFLVSLVAGILVAMKVNEAAAKVGSYLLDTEGNTVFNNGVAVWIERYTPWERTTIAIVVGLVVMLVGILIYRGIVFVNRNRNRNH